MEDLLRILKGRMFFLLLKAKTKKGKHPYYPYLLDKIVHPLNTFPLGYLDWPLCFTSISQITSKPRVPDFNNLPIKIKSKLLGSNTWPQYKC